MWHIELLGRLRAADGEREITRFRAANMAALFAYLAYYADKPHPREILIDEMWPRAASLDAGRNNLSTALNNFRHRLEPLGVAPGTVLRTDRATVQFNPDAIHTDVSDFKAILQKAGKAQNPEARAELLIQALGVYQGHLLPGLYYDWVLRERQHLAALFERAAHQLIAHFKTTGQPDLAIAYAARLVAAAPTGEEACRELMRLYRAQGQYDAALGQYSLLEQNLARLLDDKPSPATRALVAEIEKEKRRGGEGERQGTGNREQGTEEEKTEDGRRKTEEANPQSAIGNRQSAISSTHITLLLTDIERSTLQWLAGGEKFADVLAQHHALLRDVFRQHGGVEVKETGDGFIVVFESIANALAGSTQAQQALAARQWPMEMDAPRVRMALHTGYVQWDNGDARGLAIHHAARLNEAAHGGQILCSEAAFQMAANTNDLEKDTLEKDVAETGVRLKPLGVYRLRDFPDAQRLFQVCWPDMPRTDFPPIKALPGHADLLPLSATRFVGREQELSHIQLLLSPSTPEKNVLPCRLLTLTGLGGTGKSRLALELARRMVEPMEGAVWYAPLADVADARGMADALRQHLRLPRAPGADLLDQLTGLLSRRPSLLVLDNFEQLLTARNRGEEDNTPEEGAEEEGRNGREDTASGENTLDAAALVGELLERAPTLTILVTSRHLLRLAEEREFAVPPMQVPDVVPPVAPSQHNAYLAKLNGCESVRLFVDRAQDARADFQLTAKNAPVIAQLCARLEGIPLAIELAAARAQILTPAQMLAQLEDRFKFLVTRYRNITPRQRSLRASLDVSYALLSPALQRFLAQLSIFRGGWTWEAAEAIAKDEGGRMKDEDREQETGNREQTSPTPNTQHPTPSSSFDVLDYLAELRDSSLVVAEESGEQIRFRLLETLREYADEQLSEQQREGLRQAHYAYYLGMAEQSEPELNGPDQAEWLNRLESEHDNLRAALRGTDDAESRFRLAGALYRFWERRDHFQEGRFWLEPTEHAGDIAPLVQAKALNGAGVLAVSQGDYNAAKQFLEHSLTLSRSIPDAHGMALASNNMGNVLRVQGDYEAAQSSYELALATWQKAQDWLNVARVSNNLGIIALNLGDAALAQSRFEASLQMSRRARDDMQAASALVNLGRVFSDEGKQDEAQTCFEQSLALFRALGIKASVAVVLLNLGGIVLKREGFASAWPLFVESLRIRQEVEHYSGIPIVLEVMAQAMLEQKQWQCAARLLGAATALRQTLGAPLPPSERDEHARDIKAIQEGMGIRAFETAWAQGLAMNREQAVAYASEQKPE